MEEKFSFHAADEVVDGCTRISVPCKQRPFDLPGRSKGLCLQGRISADRS